MGIEKQVDEEHGRNCLFVKAEASPLNTFTFIVTVCRWQDHIALPSVLPLACFTREEMARVVDSLVSSHRFPEAEQASAPREAQWAASGQQVAEVLTNVHGVGVGERLGGQDGVLQSLLIIGGRRLVISSVVLRHLFLLIGGLIIPVVLSFRIIIVGTFIIIFFLPAQWKDSTSGTDVTGRHFRVQPLWDLGPGCQHPPGRSVTEGTVTCHDLHRWETHASGPELKTNLWLSTGGLKTNLHRDPAAILKHKHLGETALLFLLYRINRLCFPIKSILSQSHFLSNEMILFTGISVRQGALPP